MGTNGSKRKTLCKRIKEQDYYSQVLSFEFNHPSQRDRFDLISAHEGGFEGCDLHERGQSKDTAGVAYPSVP